MCLSHGNGSKYKGRKGLGHEEEYDPAKDIEEDQPSYVVEKKQVSALKDTWKTVQEGDNVSCVKCCWEVMSDMEQTENSNGSSNLEIMVTLTRAISADLASADSRDEEEMLGIPR